MAQFPITNEVVFPTFNDVGVVAGDGKRWSETRVVAWVLAALGTLDFTKTGLTVPPTSVNLDIVVGSGTAFLKGYYCTIPATTVTASPSTATFVFLRLLKDINGNVTAAVYETQATASPAPADSMPICQLNAGLTTITSTLDLSNRSAFPMSEQSIQQLGAVTSSVGAGGLPPALTLYTVPAGKHVILKHLFLNLQNTSAFTVQNTNLELVRAGVVSFLQPTAYAIGGAGGFAFSVTEQDTLLDLRLEAGDIVRLTAFTGTYFGTFTRSVLLSGLVFDN